MKSMVWKRLWRQNAAGWLLMAIFLAGCGSSVLLGHRLAICKRQMETIQRDTKILCTVTDVQVSNTERIEMLYGTFLPLVGTHRWNSPSLAEFVTAVKAIRTIPLQSPQNREIRAIHSLDSDPDLVAEGVTVTPQVGYSEKLFEGSDRVCLIPEADAALYPDGRISVTREDGVSQTVSIVGTVSGGPAHVYYIPLNMSWSDEWYASAKIDRCSFSIRDNTRLEEAKDALYTLFFDPQDVTYTGKSNGLIIHDGDYLAALDECGDEISLLKTVLPLLAFLTLFVGLIWFFQHIDRRKREAEQSLWLHRRLETQSRSIAALEKSYRSQRRAGHEFNHHMGVLWELLSRGDAEAATAYLEKLQISRNAQDFAVNTHHPLLDAILNQKYQWATAQGIDMEFRVNDLSGLQMPMDELVVVLSNLLDNAVEACLRLEEGRAIRCSILLGEELYLSIRNTSKPVVIHHGGITTSKTPKAEHGFGLPELCRILTDWGAEFTYDYEDGWFRFVAEIPCINI